MSTLTVIPEKAATFPSLTSQFQIPMLYSTKEETQITVNCNKE